MEVQNRSAVYPGSNPEPVSQCPRAFFLVATAGLDHSVKVWSPIAAAARLPGRAAEAVMEENASAREEDLNEPEFSFSHFIHQLQRTSALATRWALVQNSVNPFTQLFGACGLVHSYKCSMHGLVALG